MVVGVVRLSLFLADNDSLKGKRSVVRSLIGKVRAKFNLAAAEVGALDEHRRAELGFAVVSNQRRHAQAMLSKLIAYCEKHAEAEIAGVTTELLPMGSGVGAPMVADSDLDLPPSWSGEKEPD